MRPTSKFSWQTAKNNLPPPEHFPAASGGGAGMRIALQRNHFAKSAAVISAKVALKNWQD